MHTQTPIGKKEEELYYETKPDSMISYINKQAGCCCVNFTKQKLDQLDVKVTIRDQILKVEENPNALKTTDKYQINFLYPPSYQEETHKLHTDYQTAEAKSPSKTTTGSKEFRQLSKPTKNKDKTNQSVMGLSVNPGNPDQVVSKEEIKVIVEEKPQENEAQQLLDAPPAPQDLVSSQSKQPAKDETKAETYDESHIYFLHLVALISAFCIEMNKRVS